MVTIAPWLAVLALLLAEPALAADKPATPSTRAAKAPVRKPAAPPPLADATPEQMEAANRVYYGRHDCEVGQVLDIQADAKHPGYVDVRHGKAVYVMKPVVSSTGAIRLEDVTGKTLLVQIATKSMLMDVQAGHRLVDDCVGTQQREALDAQRRTGAAALWALGAASVPAAAPAAAPAASASSTR
jgi:hypothetical protein